MNHHGHANGTGFDGAAVEQVEPPPLLAENAALRDRLLRALAETDNTRRQAERSASDARKYAICEFAREMLGVSDNLHRTLFAANRQSSGGDAALLEGVSATERILESVLERFGLRKIDGLGLPFDPNFQEAVLEVDDPSRPSGTVATVLEDGYTIHDRLVRPARVAVVARRPNG